MRGLGTSGAIGSAKPFEEIDAPARAGPIEGREFGGLGTLAKRALIAAIGVIVVVVIGYCAFIVAANRGIDTSFR